MAMYDGHRQVAELLLANQADINAQSVTGETPLHVAVRKGHRELVELLLSRNADVNARDRQDRTPLHVAAAAGHAEVVRALLGENADLLARDKSGRTPKATASESGHWEIVALLTPRVGGLGDPQRFVFEGAKTFSAEALREALQGASDFFEVSHPLAPQDAFLEAMEKKLQLGYQHEGFPEAQVTVRPDAKAGKVLVKVTEGPRYLCGGVKVSGAQRMPAAAIVERLTVPQAPAGPAQRAFEFPDKAPSNHALDEPGPDWSRQTEAYWAKGTPSRASEIDLREMKALVTTTMREHGFLSPKVNVLVVPDKATQTAELQVEVIEEGPSGVIDRIEVTGNRTNKSEAVVRYLDVQPGTPLTGELIARIEDRLWRAARFLDYKVGVGSPDGRGRLPLQIQVVEYEDAPPLDQEFSRSEQAMLKLREWLSRLDDSREDMVVRITGATNGSIAVESVISPVNGVALVLGNSSGGAKGVTEYAAVLRANLFGVYSVAGGRKLQMACPQQQLQAYARVSSHAPGTNAGPFNVELGAGFGTEGADPASAPPYRFKLTLPPVACVGLVHRLELEDRFEGDVLIRSNATALLKVNTQTGRLMELRFTKDDWSCEARFERGAFERAVKRIESDTAKLPDAYDTNAPLSSAAAFLAEEASSSRYLASWLRAGKTSEGASRLPALLRQLNLANVLSPLNQLLPQEKAGTSGKTGFWIPEEPGAAPSSGNSLMDVIGGWLLRHSGQLVEDHSWPRTLLREAVLVVLRQGRYTDQVVTEVYESSETGPLAYWATASLVGRTDSPWKQKFAARGLERLSAEDFRRDCRVLLTGQSVLSQCFQKLAAALGQLSDEELAAVVEKQSPPRAAFIRDCARRLREAKEQAAFDAIAPALDIYWQDELKEVVAAGLRKEALDAVETYRKALRLYESEGLASGYGQAAELFKQAADAGHAGAQVLPGPAIRKGQGR